MSRLLWSCVVALVMSCGSSSSSGVSGSKKLVALSADEELDLCDYLVGVIDAPRTVACSDGSTVELTMDDACSFEGVPESCEATVSDAERCAKALGRNPCTPDFAACAALFQCAFSSD
jgi:hypothetical protein